MSLFEKALHDEWRSRAACTQVDPESFYPEIGQADVAAAALRLCRNTCPVRLACLAAALKEEGGVTGQHRFGIRGGLTPMDRGRLIQTPRKKIA